jgi:hypothetical protein
MADQQTTGAERQQRMLGFASPWLRPLNHGYNHSTM